jgi:hypothetical protein
MKKVLLVVDGQGGGIGKAIIGRIRSAGIDAEVIACGTNSIATGVMLKAGADDAATGENAIIYNSGYADVILGPIGIVSANALLGEISPAVSRAVGEARAPKLLIPLNKCNLYIAGVASKALSDKLDDLVEKLKELLR